MAKPGSFPFTVLGMQVTATVGILDAIIKYRSIYRKVKSSTLILDALLQNQWGFLLCYSLICLCLSTVKALLSSTYRECSLNCLSPRGKFLSPRSYHTPTSSFPPLQLLNIMPPAVCWTSDSQCSQLMTPSGASFSRSLAVNC